MIVLLVKKYYLSQNYHNNTLQFRNRMKNYSSWVFFGGNLARAALASPNLVPNAQITKLVSRRCGK
jgi:hypothetical protein